MGMPSIKICSRTISLVVPAISVTIAVSSPDRALSKDDLPTFGAPTNTICKPSRNTAPCFAVNKTALISVCKLLICCDIFAFCKKSSSSSGKSITASTNIRKSINFLTILLILLEKTPLNERAAMRAAFSPDAAIKSATLSALTKSILPFKNARRENSPASAILAPSCKTRCKSKFSTTAPPCPCNSITSSPVKEWGAGKNSNKPWSNTSP